MSVYISPLDAYLGEGVPSVERLVSEAERLSMCAIGADQSVPSSET